MVVRRKVATKTRKATKGEKRGFHLTRQIGRAVERELWGVAAGRCEIAGCNLPLWKSPLTRARLNLSQKAHIYSFAKDGPRGRGGLAATEVNAIENLILVCPACHIEIDKDNSGGRFTADLLRRWKKEHEERVERVTGIDPGKKSHVLLYGANIGEHSSPLNFHEAATAMFPLWHPADELTLGTINAPGTEHDADYWGTEAKNLALQFDRVVKSQLSLGRIAHLSVFALAPQPLLVLLGTKLIDITNADVYQRHREPQTWTWPESAPAIDFEIHAPAATEGSPVLILALSAPITDDRITSVLPDACIWKVTVANPRIDLIKSRDHLASFREVMRNLLDKIKAIHGQTTTLHVFPAAPAAVAVELGRIRMPKALMPWQLYDQVNACGGFVPAISIGE